MSRTPRSQLAGRVLRALLAVLLIAFHLVPAPVARAASTWTVCVSSCNYTSLASALADANVHDGDLLQLTGSDYPENGITIAKSVVITGTATTTIGGGSAAVFLILQPISVTIQSLIIQNGRSTSLRGGGGILVDEPAAQLTLDRVTLRNNSINPPGDPAFGGGISSAGALTITNSVVASNIVTGTSSASPEDAAGGGIYAFGPSLYISNTKILTNSVLAGSVTTGILANGARASGGGVLYRPAGAGLLTVLSSTVSANQVVGGAAGGRESTTGGTALGGGVAIAASPSTTTTVAIERTSILSNTARGGGPGDLALLNPDGGDASGGGIWSDSVTSLLLQQTQVLRNTATGGIGGAPTFTETVGGAGGSVAGAGLRVAGLTPVTPTLVISSSAIVSNIATSGAGGAGSSGVNAGDGGDAGSSLGGGIYAGFGMTITNSTIALNRTTAAPGGAGGAGTNGGDGGAGGSASGAGLYLGAGGHAIASSTVASNTVSFGLGGALGAGTAVTGTAGISGTAAGGGASLISATLSSLASIYARNAATAGPEINGPAISLGGNFVLTTTGTSGFLTPTDSLLVDPLLSPPADTGGPTPTSALLPASPAIGFAGLLDCPSHDQRGQPRRTAYCDSGAYAAQPNSLAVVGGNTSQSTVVGADFGTALSVKTLYGTGVLTGASVSFTGPITGPSAVFSGTVVGVVTATNGVAVITATANLVVGGPYQVAANSGTAAPALFNLTNAIRSTSTVVTSSPNPSGPGLLATISATTTATGGVPTGGIIVLGGVGETCQIAAPAGSCQILFNSTGDRVLRATYAGDEQHRSSFGQTTHGVVSGAGGVQPPPGLTGIGNRVLVPNIFLQRGF